MLITGCTDASADLSTEPTSGSLEVATTMTTDMTSGTTGETTTTTLSGAQSTSTTSATSTTSTSATSTSATSTTATSTTAGKAATTTSANLVRPKLSVSQTANLNPNGTSVTVRGTGYDISKGVYVIVCTQAAPGPQATCVGGVNIDGSSSSSVWVSSNPPGYGVGLTTPFSPDGSFTVELVVVARSGALDCTVVKCGVVTRSDHLRYTDRSQDAFVPITFSN